MDRHRKLAGAMVCTALFMIGPQVRMTIAGEASNSLAKGSGNVQPARKARTAKSGLVNESGSGADVKSAKAQSTEIELLKQLIAAQQRQIDQLREAMEEQKQMLQQALNEKLGPAPRAPNLGDVADLKPALPSAAKPPETAPNPAAGFGATPGTQDQAQGVNYKVDQLENSVASLHQGLADVQKEVKSAPVLAGWTGSHPYIRSRDGNFEMEFGGRVQLDWRSYTGATTPPSSFFIRRARLEAEGHLFKHYEYKVQGDFADTGSLLLRDGYININYHPAAQFQFGQFKAPFSQEELQSSKYIDFVERSSVNNLVPGRTPGLMFHGQPFGGIFEYYAGAFNGRKELAANNTSTPEGYVRLRFTPLKHSGPALFKNFSLGGAFADGRHRGDSSFAGRTSSRSKTFFSAVPVRGEIVRANAEFWWRYKSFSLRGEYDQTHQARENLNGDGINLPGVIGKGLVFQTTYLLTGEEKTTGGITPKKNFLGGQGGAGAWELAFRYENVQMHDSANANRAEAYTFGVNWWLTKFVRYQSNFAYERFKDPARAATPGETGHFAYLSRMQVIF